MFIDPHRWQLTKSKEEPMHEFQKTLRPGIDTSQLFRMPWTNSDNAFSWLEITRRCNLNCDYCYQENRPDSDKDLPQVENELQTLLRIRKCDTIFISGGEPLLHPQLNKIIAMVSAAKVKAVLVTNGHALTREVVSGLKTAGLFGFILHIDRGQSRPGWTGKSEKELNRLRQYYADMIYAAKDLICGFNTTIMPETLHEVADIVRWTVMNINKVCANTLIPVRVPREDDPWELYVHAKKIDFQDTAFASKKYKNPSGINLSAQDIFTQVRKAVPEFKDSAFLGGTEISDAPKWLFGNIIGTPKKVCGHMGPKSMEIIQNGYHLAKGRFLSFLRPGFYAKGKLLFALAPIDKGIRQALLSFLGATIKNPFHLFKKLWIQSILILQPQDVLPSGRQDLCDGCPNKTILDGRLVSMCRAEEFIRFGDMVTLKKKALQDRDTSKAVCKQEVYPNVV
jgi:pyruvate-formate lyase-activating enzyme